MTLVETVQELDAKNRNGAIGSISLGWLPEQMKFLERISA